SSTSSRSTTGAAVNWSVWLARVPEAITGTLNGWPPGALESTRMSPLNGPDWVGLALTSTRSTPPGASVTGRGGSDSVTSERLTLIWVMVMLEVDWLMSIRRSFGVEQETAATPRSSGEGTATRSPGLNG